ncbi:hypothetical protein PTSG_05062 [Salpingoeca rosetta]|uniref:Uncharacterized protein n=1 Tax=Salpingoeca rosetta (strain ATCC 50818 / BSB-021) TaxID=946362 RepID=F2U9E7_SALR5|nr:uncharacterized protein PTSG_05062 [Salpingoeca rosetta]EGD73350.1 hypothetical protein PTSG_05062 [Salpingoeca rosetta]|eukprot:XP_004994380.1 hypothetical protein PTSG_05062 [Salpingoeca rosetta]
MPGKPKRAFSQPLDGQHPDHHNPPIAVVPPHLQQYLPTSSAAAAVATTTSSTTSSSSSSKAARKKTRRKSTSSGSGGGSSGSYGLRRMSASQPTTQPRPVPMRPRRGAPRAFPSQFHRLQASGAASALWSPMHMRYSAAELLDTTSDSNCVTSADDDEDNEVDEVDEEAVIHNPPDDAGDRAVFTQHAPYASAFTFTSTPTNPSSSSSSSSSSIFGFAGAALHNDSTGHDDDDDGDDGDDDDGTAMDMDMGMDSHAADDDDDSDVDVDEGDLAVLKVAQVAQQAAGSQSRPKPALAQTQPIAAGIAAFQSPCAPRTRRRVTPRLSISHGSGGSPQQQTAGCPACAEEPRPNMVWFVGHQQGHCDEHVHVVARDGPKDALKIRHYLARRSNPGVPCRMLTLPEEMVQAN